MDTLSPAGQVKLSLMLIIILSIGFGMFTILASDSWEHGHALASIAQTVLAVIFLGVALLHAYKIFGLVR
jgi:hypothetical protein